MTSDPGNLPGGPEQAPVDTDVHSSTPTSGPPVRDRFRGSGRAIITAIVQGSPGVGP